MRRNKSFIILAVILSVTLSALGQSNNATLFGKITDGSGKPVDMANISLKGFPIGTVSNADGEYLLRVPSKKQITIVYSIIGYQPVERSIRCDEEERRELNITLQQTDQQIDEVQVTQLRRNKTNITRIDSKFINNVTDASGNGVEALIKTLPGVSTNNELSSQYSVRGGNFDENLVYVNDIEVYRPFLVRSGQQEGLSFINSDMVSSIEFSAGGFSAKYGDKMSSVLDIKYRKPTELAGSANLDFMGGTLQLEDISKNGKWSHITGVRYKTNRYMLGSLDEKGDYNPRFTDVQTYITYAFNKKFDLSFLGNLANNNYQFIPENRKTSFGTWNQAYNTTIYFEGQEIDKFNTATGAISANYHPNNQLNLKLIASAFRSTEEENYDILGEYYLNELERDMSSGNGGDSALNVGIGAFLNHARNNLEANVRSLEHKGAFNTEKHLLNWGVKFQREVIDDVVNEWVMRDSAGYSLPHHNNPDKLELYSSANAKNKLSSNRISAYIQDTYQIPVSSGSLYFNGGIRTQYWDYSGQTVISPRVSFSYFPEKNPNVSYHLSGGIYAQPAFYKELKNLDGQLTTNAKAQQSAQILVGSDYIFQAWERPFKFTTELYYKYLWDLAPYQVDNVRIRYLSDQKATGYATGLDMKVNGEFVSGVESWASLSVMQTKEDIAGDGHGYIPRPTDQRINFSIYFQDYLPGNPSYKMHLTAFYGSRLPTGPPKGERWQDTYRMPPYRRIDMGLSKVLVNEEHKFKNSRFLNEIKDMWLSLEVFNLLGVNNTISYFWVSSNSGDMYAVPNYLTGRKLNLKLSVRF
jgi:hypothetical protein